MAELVRADAPGAIDIVTYAPANPSHVRERGFDHGAILARVVAKCLRLPVGHLLERGRGAPLTGQSAGERHGGPPLRPHRTARKAAAWPLLGQSVLLVDDVVTTGATMASAAVQLRAMGAAVVFAVAAAYTPAPGARAEIVMKLPSPPR
jgi:predicted amidophosphoribosyltransferase